MTNMAGLSVSALLVLMMVRPLAAKAPTFFSDEPNVRRLLSKRRLSSGIDLTSSDGFKASTTQFSFSKYNSCGCSSNSDIVSDLAKVGYYGVATTAWMGSPYNGYADSSWSCKACNDKTCFSDITDWDTSYTSCSAGLAGCTVNNAQCWELTVTNEDNIYGVQLADTGTVVNVVVMDNCEMFNEYGNNQQWCIPFTGVPSGGCQIDDGCASTSCSSSGDSLTQVAGSWDSDGAWSFGDCGSADDFQCTNAAGQPAHFDMMMTGLDSDLLPWDSGANPIVTAKPITCSSDATSLIAGACTGSSSNWCDSDSSTGAATTLTSSEDSDSDSSSDEAEGTDSGKKGSGKKGGKKGSGKKSSKLYAALQIFIPLTGGPAWGAIGGIAVLVAIGSLTVIVKRSRSQSFSPLPSAPHENDGIEDALAEE